MILQEKTEKSLKKMNLLKSKENLNRTFEIDDES